MWEALFIASILLNGYLLFRFKPWLARSEKEATQEPESVEPPASSADDVGQFYDQQTDNFLKVYGEVIQAFRTTDITRLLDYQVETIGLKEGMKVLDAGCGVCGPARYFALKTGVQIDAVTISQVQVDKSQKLIQEDDLQDLVKVHHGDYHQLNQQFDNNSYHAVYFLESFGHAAEHHKVLDAAWEVLKPGGVLYIKDLFIKEGAYPGHGQAIAAEVGNINKAYHYNIPALNQILTHIRQKGWILSNLKTIDVQLEDFENLTISNDFQELTGINKIDDLKSYIFPVDFFELKCLKPWYDVGVGDSRYFLQNLYYLQVQGKKEEEL